MNYNATIKADKKHTNTIIGLMKDHFKDAVISMKSFSDKEGIDKISLSIPYKPLIKSINVHLDILLPKLEDKEIEYSVQYDDQTVQWEKHFRLKGDETQRLLWNEYEFKKVDTEVLREALMDGGETAVLTLLDQADERYVVWPWSN